MSLLLHPLGMWGGVTLSNKFGPCTSMLNVTSAAHEGSNNTCLRLRPSIATPLISTILSPEEVKINIYVDLVSLVSSFVYVLSQ